jgi:hypothetical protein
MTGNINIYVSGSKDAANKVTAWCNNWEDTKWEVTIELTMSWSDRNILFDNTKPGFVSQRDLGLGQREYVDTTYASGNTLIIDPVSGYGLDNMYDEITIAVRNIEDEPINKDYIVIKIMGAKL